MKRKFITILLTTFGSVLLILAVLWNDNSRANNFNRKFIQPQIKFLNGLELEYNTFLSCNTEQGVWMQNRSNPFTIFSIGDSFKQPKKISFFPPKGFNLTRVNYDYGQVDSSTFITNDVGEIVRLNKFESNFYSIPNHRFDSPAILSKNTVFVRSFAKVNSEDRLEITKIIINDSARIQKSYILPKQIDGIFCADGRLRYDKESAKLFYMYYYRGEILCLDTNLKVLYKVKTIDTVRIAKLSLTDNLDVSHTGTRNHGRSLRRTSIMVNKNFSISNNRLYIDSDLKADNQSASDYLNNSSIDVYSIKTGKYLHSFDIGRYKGRKIGQFFVEKDEIFALHQNILVKYSFNE
ncbi:hypothetical protein [Pedobacter hartonius]|uniref:Uncharacterized protein n=1 Tax=Pedobacter hartonius TaxID=425514 RepID=A0A1H4CY08_9SPHI|nr:hypothetical protein [Pedobacter hartonius]SEA65373.1 hypothetical protein SAMN05443550_104248 [Pedobacter hartonius]